MFFPSIREFPRIPIENAIGCTEMETRTAKRRRQMKDGTMEDDGGERCVPEVATERGKTSPYHFPSPTSTQSIHRIELDSHAFDVRSNFWTNRVSRCARKTEISLRSRQRVKGPRDFFVTDLFVTDNPTLVSPSSFLSFFRFGLFGAQRHVPP